jgi:hypothetical protein
MRSPEAQRDKLSWLISATHGNDDELAVVDHVHESADASIAKRGSQCLFEALSVRGLTFHE